MNSELCGDSVVTGSETAEKAFCERKSFERWVLVVLRFELSAGGVEIFHHGELTFLRSNVNSNSSQRVTEKRLVSAYRECCR